MVGISKLFLMNQRTLYHVSVFYKCLPESFFRKYAIKQVAPKIWLQPRTVDKYLNALVLYGKLRRERGMYIKEAGTPPEPVSDRPQTQFSDK